MATTTVTCFNDRNYRDNTILAIRDTRMMVGAEYAGENYREYFGAMQFAIPALYDQNITSARLYLYVTESKIKVTLEPQFYDIKEEIKVNVYDSFINQYGDKYVLSGPESKTFESSSTVYNTWIALNITNLVVGNNNNSTFTIVLKDTEINQWASGSGGVPTPYVCHISTIEGGNAPYIVIEHENARPFKPTILYPDGDVVPNSGNLIFKWKYNAGVSAGQAKYEFGWKMQAETQWNTTTITTTVSQHTLNAALLKNGIAEWRVRTYNNLGMVSEYATGQFYVVGKPGNPVITGIKNDAITEILWSAERSEESSARIKIIENGKQIYDSGIISGGIEDAHKPNIILANGTYSAVLSIANIYDLWSDPVTKSFTINCSRPTTPQLQAIGCGDYVRLDFKGDSETYYIYRSDKEHKEFLPIACIKNVRYNANGYTYLDYAVKSNTLYQYFIRAYNGGISDSAVKDTYVRYDGFYLSEVSDMSTRVKLILSDTDEYIMYGATKENINQHMRYIGRTYPVKESGPFARTTFSVSAFLFINDFRILETIFEKNGIYCFRGKDMLYFVDITSLSASNTWFDQGYAVSLSMEIIDYSGVVNYV